MAFEEFNDKIQKVVEGRRTEKFFEELLETTWEYAAGYFEKEAEYMDEETYEAFLDKVLAKMFTTHLKEWMRE